MRPNDFGFTASEKLWRRVSAESVVGNRVKPNTLRLQMSVSREKYAAGPTPGAAPFTRVAEILVRDAYGITVNEAVVVCMDLPTHNDDSHSTIAIVTAPDATVPREDFWEVRRLLASRMVPVV
jgi:hypothetical protein